MILDNSNINSNILFGMMSKDTNTSKIDIKKNDIEKVPVKDEWKGDLSEDYKSRYTYYFPKELETLGLPAEEETGGWGGKK